MRHDLDAETATEASGMIWERCRACECWVAQHDPRDGCDGPSPRNPIPLETHIGALAVKLTGLEGRAIYRLDELLEDHRTLLLKLDGEFAQLEQRICRKAAWSFAATIGWITTIGAIILLLAR